jgi:hypothetical protein
MTCELCKTNSGRTNSNLECCQIRYLAQMPNNRLLQAVDSLNRAERAILRPKIEAERKRLRNLK